VIPRLASGAIAVDAMGGDEAPAEVVRGAVEAARDLSIPVVLVGQERALRRRLNALRPLPSSIDLVDAPEVVRMDDSPLVVLRSKRRSSLSVGAELVRDGLASALVTAGNTGAAWVTARAVLGMLEGVDRPALAAILPGAGGSTLLLDVGATLECRPHHFRQFAVMGSCYAASVLGVPQPRVGLLSVGEEEGKGGRRLQEYFRVLDSAGINFVGNIDGRDLYGQAADVVVCDGFTGNVILKVSESLGEMIISTLADEARRSPLYGVGLVVAKGAFRNLRRRVDYSEHGGAPVLGVNGACLIGHGRSSAKAIRNAIRYARSYADSGILERMAAQIAQVEAVDANGPIRRPGR
jgi:glycerol-3-phosphate acyltransferase PlsX